ncbi:oligoendopeptidase F [Blastopirellula marina]|uniref:Oligopeptidase F n=1 Tax=Blastopirellula marina TaxID=124 RepID=A0A2S8FXD6_9BACT|nr:MULTISPECIES: oligoendopeptidase F [Pirellulaceae]PQO36846.1 oligoendopeptidase F [Blastopirellula marina]RCS53561.1 oligoendopeptidase F [Bremerella cremea]
MATTAKAAKKSVKKLLTRDEVATNDTWDLSSLYPDSEAWEKDFKKLAKKEEGFDKFRGTLAKGAKELLACLKFDSEVDRLGEKLGVYAFLRTTEDQANDESQRRMARFQAVASKLAQAASYIAPEIQAIPGKRLQELMDDPVLKGYRLVLERMTRYKKYTLGKKEERILAMQSEMAGAAGKAFRQLLDADMKFGTVKNENGEEQELTNSTLMEFLLSPDRKVRKKAFEQYYAQFEGHENTLAATLSGSIQKDVYYAKVRGYDSARGQALYADNIPESVYDNLINSVHNHLPAVHRYFELRRRKMKLKDIRHYDTYVPILSNVKTKHTWDQAVEVIMNAMIPLGPEYCDVLHDGLTKARWCDRYPNAGKQSGAFSCGSFDAAPFILMNYKPDVLDDVFTLAHEAGHSMHSYYSSKSQPYQYYNYVIFVAEVASTFNEQLLSQHLQENANTDLERAYLINRDIDAIRGTIIRQTMFAEFEKITHAMCEAGEPLTSKSLQEVYQGLLERYFGPDFVIDPQLKLECLRIPHFYRAFYVYKYATGLSAAIALSMRVLNGGKAELDDYLSFLKGGCSKYPLDLLRDAGVDMESPKPVDMALSHFESLVDQLDDLL